MAAALFVFEGADGVGKSRRCGDTSKYIKQLGLPCDVFSFPGKKPGSLGHVVHTLHNSPRELGLPSVLPAALQTLHIAAQLDSIERDIFQRLRRDTLSCSIGSGGLRGCMVRKLAWTRAF